MTRILDSNLSFCLIFIHILLLFVCPVLEIWKLRLFKDNDLSINIIEYVYLGLIFCQILVHTIMCCCFRLFNVERLKITFVLSAILWLIIPAIYTHATINELGNIPFFCPNDFTYPSIAISITCKVRASNLILMWIRFITIISILIFIILESEKLNSWFGKKGSNNRRPRSLSRSRRNSKSNEVGAQLVFDDES